MRWILFEASQESLVVKMRHSGLGLRGLILAKLKAAAVHAVCTVVVGIVSAALVFKFWFPEGSAQFSGGTELFFLILGVELCLGPLMSLVIFDPLKSKTQLFRDYAVIGIVQSLALSYGLYSTFSARLIYKVFVVDQFKIVAARDLDPKDLISASTEDFKVLPFRGLKTICVSFPESVTEKSELLFSGLAGKDIELFPKYYRECRDGELIKNARQAKELSQLLNRKNDSLEQYGLDELAVFSWQLVHGGSRFWIEVYPNNNPDRAYFVDFDPYY